VDYDSQQPVNGATIMVACKNSEYKEPISVLNETSGDFTVPSSRSWGVLFIGPPVDFFYPRWLLTITAPGYQIRSEEFQTNPLSSKPLQLGTITLKKELASVDPPPDSKAPP